MPITEFWKGTITHYCLLKSASTDAILIEKCPELLERESKRTTQAQFSTRHYGPFAPHFDRREPKRTKSAG